VGWVLNGCRTICSNDMAAQQQTSKLAHTTASPGSLLVHSMINDYDKRKYHVTQL
jgi:hypothetical protein